MADSMTGARISSTGNYVPRLLEHAQRGELDASFLATHHFGLEDGPRGYQAFKEKGDGCVRVVFTPGAAA